MQEFMPNKLHGTDWHTNTTRAEDEQLDTLFGIMRDFEDISDAKFSIKKTIGLRLGEAAGLEVAAADPEVVEWGAVAMRRGTCTLLLPEPSPPWQGGVALGTRGG